MIHVRNVPRHSYFVKNQKKRVGVSMETYSPARLIRKIKPDEKVPVGSDLGIYVILRWTMVELGIPSSKT